jgi:acyl-CoA synthetase (AMP-forming)/AMP-acid ligase II
MESLSQTLSSTGSAGPVARDMIRRAERFYPDKTAVVCGDERWTYRQFGIRIRKVAGALTSLGLNKGDRVAVLMLNCHRYLELFAACFELGAIIVPLNILYWLLGTSVQKQDGLSLLDYYHPLTRNPMEGQGKRFF